MQHKSIKHCAWSNSIRHKPVFIFPMSDMYTRNIYTFSGAWWNRTELIFCVSSEEKLLYPVLPCAYKCVEIYCEQDTREISTFVEMAV